MFKLATNSFYKHKVQVSVPQDLGKTVTASFVVHFAALTRERIEEVVRQIQDGDLTESELLREVVVGFEDVADEDGQPLEFTEHNRDRLLNVPYVHNAVMAAFLENISGPQDRRKN